MNVLILTTHMNAGGISRYVLNLSRGLADLGHRVWIASSGGAWTAGDGSRGVRHVHIPILTKSLVSPKVFMSLSRLKKLVRTENIDIIHCNTRVTQFLGYLLSKHTHIPYVSAFHGFYSPRLLRAWFHLAGERSIAVSEAVKHHLTKDLGIDADRIRVVYNGIDTSELVENCNVRQRLGYGPQDYLAGILGRISEEKGHFLAVEAFHMLAARYPALRLVANGTGKLKGLLEAYVKKLNLQGRVRIVDCTANEFLSTVDCLLVPSQKEGFGYAIVEAFAKGVPVIGYNTGGIAEIIRHKINGLIFYDYRAQSLADAIEEVITKESLRMRLVAQAKEDSSAYTLERMALDTEKIYWEITARGTRPTT